ncbi:hypothetical protein CQA66_02490 [Helicobacter aurati]|uniref:Uncharacterized protein n=1 Tax=Helicobacter aurati TaxID=137778 RepID=A0A3D8J6K5_9HELI|nr:hypothetical protein [Helicobacter aurati]RDU73113.1 hypothetical protein CQA66_02490 [Helicobacter aurati]
MPNNACIKILPFSLTQSLLIRILWLLLRNAYLIKPKEILHFHSRLQNKKLFGNSLTRKESWKHVRRFTIIIYKLPPHISLLFHYKNIGFIQE